MKRTGACPKCGSREISADVKAIDRSHGNVERELSIATFREPDALLFKGKQQSTLSVWVCLGCGFVEFYADEPDQLRIRATP
jgi:predicted nucleic-acid-binding Zn-ribbon protein